MGRSALILILAAAACSSKDAPPVIGPQRPDGGTPCQAGDSTCRGNLRCVNRNCVPTCPGDAGCPSGSYCEGPAYPEDVCAPLSPIACAKTFDCPDPQTCFGGLCASGQPRADGGYQLCVLNAGADDGCGPDAVCIVQGQNVCAGYPACGQDGGCPQGDIGSACNDGKNPDGGQLIPGKMRICLLGFCTLPSDCPPTSNACFRATLRKPYGYCNFGLTGSQCFTKADCFNSGACTGADGGLEDGGTPGTCG